jgi:hypothetical protein
MITPRLRDEHKGIMVRFRLLARQRPASVGSRAAFWRKGACNSMNSGALP